MPLIPAIIKNAPNIANIIKVTFSPFLFIIAKETPANEIIAKIIFRFITTHNVVNPSRFGRVSHYRLTNHHPTAF